MEREINNKLFNDKYYSIKYCTRVTIHDFIIWTTVLSDDERLHLSSSFSGDDIDDTSPDE